MPDSCSRTRIAAKGASAGQGARDALSPTRRGRWWPACLPACVNSRLVVWSQHISAPSASRLRAPRHGRAPSPTCSHPDAHPPSASDQGQKGPSSSWAPVWSEGTGSRLGERQAASLAAFPGPKAAPEHCRLRSRRQSRPGNCVHRGEEETAAPSSRGG